MRVIAKPPEDAASQISPVCSVRSNPGANTTEPLMAPNGLRWRPLPLLLRLSLENTRVRFSKSTCSVRQPASTQERACECPVGLLDHHSRYLYALFGSTRPRSRSISSKVVRTD